MPRSTHPFVCAAPAVAIEEGVNSMSWTPLLYCPELASHPLKGRTTSPLVGSIVKALNVLAAGVQAQPLPNAEVPSSVGAAGFETSRYLSEICEELAP